MKTDLFKSCGHCWGFQICWHIECSTYTASSFRIWNSSTWIPSPPLALCIVMLPKAHLTLHSRCLALGDWSHHRDYLGLEDLFCTVLLCILAISSCKGITNSKCVNLPTICITLKEMETYSSVLAWRIPGTEEPGGLPSMGSHRIKHNWSNLAAAAAGVHLSA